MPTERSIAPLHVLVRVLGEDSKDHTDKGEVEIFLCFFR